MIDEVDFSIKGFSFVQAGNVIVCQAANQAGYSAFVYPNRFGLAHDPFRCPSDSAAWGFHILEEIAEDVDIFF
jgi:hypothetical protein